MKYLTTANIVAAHDAVLRAYGGEEGGGHRGHDFAGVEAAAQSVRNSYYESPAEVAAAYAVYIVQGHVFADGNKRTGAAAMVLYLVANGVPYSISNERLASSMLEIQARYAGGERTGVLVKWLAGLLSAPL